MTKTKRLAILTTTCILIIGLLFQNCSQQMQSVDQASNSSEGQGPLEFTPTNLSKSIMSASKTLLNRLPTPSEIDYASQGTKFYRAQIEKYLGYIEFRDAMVAEHRNYLTMGGSAAGIDYDHPARLGAYLVTNNIPYKEIVTSNFCVDRNFQRLPFCDSFTDAATATANSAGVLTTRAYINTNKDKKAFNFRLVNDSFLKFHCVSYPDPHDKSPLSTSQISGKVHPWNDPKKDCYSCHRSMNPKAFLFYNFRLDGTFTTDVATTTRTDANRPSTQDDVLPVGVVPAVNGIQIRTMRDLGQMMASDPRFEPCMVKRYVNFMLGRDYTAAVPPETIDYLTEIFRSSNQDVKKLITEITMSSAYVNRGLIPSGGQ